MMTDYLRDKVFDHVLRHVAYTSPTTVYMSLWTVIPAKDGTGGTEVTGGSYVRIASPFTDPVTPGIGWNDAILTFAVPACTIVAVGVHDAASAGNMLLIGRMTRSVTVAAGAYTVAVGSLLVEMS